MTVALHSDERAILLCVARRGRLVTGDRLAIDAGIEARRLQSVVGTLCDRGFLVVDRDSWDRVCGYRIVKWPAGLRRPDGRSVTRKRSCLFCGARFKSDGAHNRICGPCKDSPDFCGQEA